MGQGVDKSLSTGEGRKVFVVILRITSGLMTVLGEGSRLGEGWLWEGAYLESDSSEGVLGGGGLIRTFQPGVGTKGFRGCPPDNHGRDLLE